MTEHKTLKTGNAFGQNFKFIHNENVGEVQLYWDDGEYSVQEITHQSPEEIEEITQIWYDEIMAANKMEEYHEHIQSGGTPDDFE